jgi:hypothetical protein
MQLYEGPLIYMQQDAPFVGHQGYSKQSRTQDQVCCGHHDLLGSVIPAHVIYGFSLHAPGVWLVKWTHT